MILSFVKEKHYLKEFELVSNNTLQAASVDIINSFPNLKKLCIKGCKFEGIFTLKPNNLEEICLDFCKNIAFDETNIFKIKKLTISRTEIMKPKSVIKLPEIEKITLDSNISSYFLCQKEKDISAPLNELINYDFSLLEHLTILENKNENILSIEKEVIEKIISCKNLKYIELKSNLNDEQIKAIDEINYSVTKIKFQNVDKIFNNFLDKFVNLSEFEYLSLSGEDEKIFEIKEDKNKKNK